MPEIQINFLSLAVATLAGFFLCFAWYTPLFGKLWAREMGVSPNDSPKGAGLARSLFLTVLGVFLISMVLANNIAVWTPSVWGKVGADMPKYAQALQAGFFTWLGFFVPTLLQAVAWDKRSWTLFSIHAGYYFTLLMLVAFITIYMR